MLLALDKRRGHLFRLKYLASVAVDSPQFQEETAKLSELLKIPPHPDPLVRLEACCKLLQSRLNDHEQSNLQRKAKCIEINLKEHDFGFTDKSLDPNLKEAAKILRLLHLKNLRKLQSEINNTIELVQSVTANPKTDTKGGKVGR